MLIVFREHAMISRIPPFIWISAMAVVFSCAAPLRQEKSKEIVLPEIDVELVRKNAESAQRKSMEVKLDLEVLTAKMAELDNRVTTLSEDLSNVSSAKIEELETQLALMTEALKNQQDLLDALLSGGPLPRQAEGTETKPGAEKAPGGTPAAASWFRGLMPGERKGAGSGFGATFSPSSAAAIIFSPEFDAYKTGLRLFSSRKYPLAIKAFTDMLQQFPNGKYSDNAHYWIGESYFASEDYALAITSFEKVLTFKGSQKTDDAQFKIGISYLKLGQHGTAKEVFQKYLDQDPGSEYAPRIKRYLKQLK